MNNDTRRNLQTVTITTGFVAMLLMAVSASPVKAEKMSWMERKSFVSGCNYEASKDVPKAVAKTYCNKAADLFELNPNLPLNADMSYIGMQEIAEKASAYAFRKHGY